MTEQKRQSPIDLNKAHCACDPNLKASDLNINWDKHIGKRVKNTGYTWNVECEGSDDDLTSPHLANGSPYRLVQFHAHWGFNEKDGSEHTVNGVEYAGEIHFVHYKVAYGSFEEAIKHGDGLAVIGVLLEERPKPDNEELNHFIDLIRKVKKPDTKIDAEPFDVYKLLPKSRDFWTYEGSLTTPPYTECVLWTVLKETIPIASEQLAEMRAIKERNVRECFPLHGRKVRSTFQM